MLIASAPPSRTGTMILKHTSNVRLNIVLFPVRHGLAKPVPEAVGILTGPCQASSFGAHADIAPNTCDSPASLRHKISKMKKIFFLGRPEKVSN